MIREEILNTKLFIICFIFSSFAYDSDLLDCTDVDNDNCHYDSNLLMMVSLLWLLLSLLGVFSPLLGL